MKISLIVIAEVTARACDRTGLASDCVTFLCLLVVFLRAVMPGGYTKHDKLVAIVELYKAKKSTKDISAQTGVNIVTVRRLLRRYKAEGERALPEPRVGGSSKPSISPSTLRTVKRCVRLNPSMSARQLKEKYKETLGNIAIRTVQHHLHLSGYRKVSAKRKPLVTARQRKKRLDFAKAYKDFTLERWRQVLWTDESTFHVSDTRGRRVWNFPGADPFRPEALATSVKFPAYLMVWGGFGYGGLTPLVFLPPNSTVNRDSYYTLLNEHLEDSFEASNTSIFQQDGAPAHTARLITGWFADCGIEYIKDWPGNSPDLSPVENLWAILKAKIKSVDTSTIPKLKAALQHAWANLDAELLKKLADSVPGRLKEVKKRKGYPIRY